MFNYQRVTSEYLDQAVDLIKRVIIEVNSKDYNPAEIELMNSFQTREKLTEKISNGAVYFIALSENQVVGVGGLAGSEVSRLFVDPQFSGQGIGTRILELIETEALSKGLSVISLGSTITAQSFYEKNGFVLKKITALEVNGLKVKMLAMEKDIEFNQINQQRKKLSDFIQPPKKGYRVVIGNYLRLMVVAGLFLFAILTPLYFIDYILNKSPKVIPSQTFLLVIILTTIVFSLHIILRKNLVNTFLPTLQNSVGRGFYNIVYFLMAFSFCLQVFRFFDPAINNFLTDQIWQSLIYKNIGRIFLTEPSGFIVIFLLLIGSILLIDKYIKNKFIGVSIYIIVCLLFLAFVAIAINPKYSIDNYLIEIAKFIIGNLFIGWFYELFIRTTVPKELVDSFMNKTKTTHSGSLSSDHLA